LIAFDIARHCIPHSQWKTAFIACSFGSGSHQHGSLVSFVLTQVLITLLASVTVMVRYPYQVLVIVYDQAQDRLRNHSIDLPEGAFFAPCLCFITLLDVSSKNKGRFPAGVNISSVAATCCRNAWMFSRRVEVYAISAVLP
jgi:hypothetical protein